METQNVSAQLYYRQLPYDTAASSYNCQNTYPNLSTCVNNTSTDAQIENAYQKQLNLTEYYKSPEVFQTMKEEFTDQTMEGQNQPTQQVTSYVYPEPPSVPVNIPVGPRDFLQRFIKEGFGGAGITLIVLTTLVVAFALWLIFRKNLHFINRTNIFKV
jgi:hypothetical protein